MEESQVLGKLKVQVPQKFKQDNRAPHIVETDKRVDKATHLLPNKTTSISYQVDEDEIQVICPAAGPSTFRRIQRSIPAGVSISTSRRTAASSQVNQASASGSGSSKAREVVVIDLSDDENVQSSAKRHKPASAPISLQSSVSPSARAQQQNASGVGLFMDTHTEVTELEEILALQNPPAPQRSDPLSTSMAEIMAILSDVDPEHVRTVLKAQMSIQIIGDSNCNNLTERTLDTILDGRTTYPKVKNLKRKSFGDGSANNNNEYKLFGSNGIIRGEKEVDYLARDAKGPGGQAYMQASFEQLYSDFPLIPVKHVRLTFMSHSLSYARTHMVLLEQSNLSDKPYQNNSSQRKSKGKGHVLTSEEYEKEREWLAAKLKKDRETKLEKEREELFLKEYEKNGLGIECQCCFGSFPPEYVRQCSDGHLFCKECVQRHAKTILGNQMVTILCMDGGGCNANFPEVELNRTLDEKLIRLWHRLLQEKAIKDAELDYIESCPFCSYSVCIENPDEKLFHCENEECGVISCRKCQKPEHLPKSCEEMEKDSKLDHRHIVEEAMTAALIRKCPKRGCGNTFLKDSGCNKMVCNKCGTYQCYVCQKVIPADYSHFDTQPGQPGYGRIKDITKCPLWEDSSARHRNEVEAARKAAQDQVKAKNADITQEDLEVDLPDAGPGAGADLCRMPAPRPAGHAPPAPLPPALQAGAYIPGLNLLGGPAGFADHFRRLRDQQAALANAHGRLAAAPRAAVPPRRRGKS